MRRFVETINMFSMFPSRFFENGDTQIPEIWCPFLLFYGRCGEYERVILSGNGVGKEYHHSRCSSDVVVMLFSKFEFAQFKGKIIVAVERYIPECNVITYIVEYA
ncbi:hypothetical protein MtrunA17_Chr8g0375651 [Medicago truncatula]|uniref:Uncharacterized protein n=1 Tax=Medicago truncatula TaxID=3880 RepID=A0A396GS40_MEDTR|nr:hypothetical protein MtrunA17_Chr8g0375651 [Medicago truncatula]